MNDKKEIIDSIPSAPSEKSPVSSSVKEDALKVDKSSQARTKTTTKKKKSARSQSSKLALYESQIDEVTTYLERLSKGDFLFEIDSNSTNNRIKKLRKAVLAMLESKIADANSISTVSSGSVNESANKHAQQQITDSSMQLASVAEQLTLATADVTHKAFSIEEEANQANQISSKLVETLREVSHAADSSQSNIESISTATEEMTTTVTEIAQNTDQAREVSDAAVALVDSASLEVDKLGIAAKQISNVTETISEIAEQTKLLALNATIEAARAGEAGKGFAVVASEVKELAQQTNAATTDIKEKIDGIQAATNRTIDEIHKITEIICNVNEYIGIIATSTEEQAITTRDIAENLAQSTLGISKVTNAVSEVVSFSQQVSKSVMGTNKHATEIKQASINLNNLSKELEITQKSLTETVKNLT